MLVDDLFELARIDSGAFTLELREGPLEEVVASCLRGLEAEAGARQVRLEARGDGAAPGRGRRAGLAGCAAQQPDGLAAARAAGRACFTLPATRGSKGYAGTSAGGVVTRLTPIGWMGSSKTCSSPAAEENPATLNGRPPPPPPP